MSNPELIVITPSRGRPDQLRRLVDAVQTTTDGRVGVVALVDGDDPCHARYMALEARPPALWILSGSRKSLSGWTNWAADKILAWDTPPRFLASLGDDHLPETADWDLKLQDAAASVVGFAYGDDGLQHGRLPTAWVVCASVVRALEWVMLPTCEHMYVDNAVMELGRAAARIAFVPGVKITHMHPLAGKAEMDESYTRTNSADQFDRDRAAFLAWRENMGAEGFGYRFERDLARLIGVTTP
jgi:hypothetical protein